MSMKCRRNANVAERNPLSLDSCGANVLLSKGQGRVSLPSRESGGTTIWGAVLLPKDGADTLSALTRQLTS